MNRRQFLQSLTAIGFSVALPDGAFATASEAAIDDAWEEAIREPMTFYVKPGGTLTQVCKHSS